MTLARILLKLWRLRLWVAIGFVLGLVVAVGTVVTSHTTVYAEASTQMLVDSPASALANSGVDMTGYLARADIFARLMTSAEALSYIGQAAGIPGNLINANGPAETDGAPTASHAAVVIQGGQDKPVQPVYKFSFLQNPELPTIDIYAQAPTTARAIALANGAVTGFSRFINQLDGNNVPPAKRIVVRQLGAATGGMVDPAASKKVALLAFLGVLAAWCGLVLFVSRLRAQLRAARRSNTDDPFDASQHELTPVGAGLSGPLLANNQGRNGSHGTSDWNEERVGAREED